MKVRLASHKTKIVDIDEKSLTLIADLECDRCHTKNRIWCNGKRMYIQDLEEVSGKLVVEEKDK